MFESHFGNQGLEARGGQMIDHTLAPAIAKKDLDALWVNRMISITMYIRIVFALMLSMVLSDALRLYLQIFMLIMYGQILHILKNNLNNYLVQLQQSAIAVRRFYE